MWVLLYELPLLDLFNVRNEFLQSGCDFTKCYFLFLFAGGVLFLALGQFFYLIL